MKRKNGMRKTAFVYCLLACAMISSFAREGDLTRGVFSRYASDVGSRTFSLGVTANFTVTYDANDGILTSPTEDGGPWTHVTETTADKILTPGSPYGVFPEVTREGYTLDTWGSNNILPGGYIEIEYVESNMNAVLDTGIRSNRLIDQAIHLDFTPLALGSWMGANGNMQISISPENGLSVGVRVNLALDKKANQNAVVTVNGVKKTTVNFNSPEYDNLPICLFALGKPGFYDYLNKVRIYSASIESNGEVVRDYLPCYEKATGRYGLFESVTKTFQPTTGILTGAAPDGSLHTMLSGITEESPMEEPFDHMVYARWSPNVYTLTLDANDAAGSTRAEGNTPDGTLQVVFDKLYSGLPTLTRAGYTFNGWFDADGNAYHAEDTVKITENKVLAASWTPNRYAIFFDPDGGTVNIESLEVTFDTPYGELPVPELPGFIFEGWSPNAAPSGYLDAEYVECHGSEYISTGYLANCNIHQKFTVDVAPTALTGYMGSNGNLQLQITAGNGFAVGKRTLSCIDKPANSTATVYADGIKKSTVSFNNYNNVLIAIGALGQSASSVFYQTKAKIYGASYEENDVLLRNFIPCCERESGEFGLFDTVSETFFRNAGGGKLTGKLITEDGLEIVTSESTVTSICDHTLIARWIPESLEEPDRTEEP